MNWNDDEQDFGNQDQLRISGWRCFLVAFLVLAVGSFAVLIGYILFR